MTATLTRPPRASGGTGTLAARPAATTVPDGYIYYAADDNGGTAYRSNGTAWSKLGAGALETGGRELAYNAKSDAAFTTTTTPTPVDMGTGTSISFVAGARPVSILAGAADMRHTVANTILLLSLVRTDTSFAMESITGSHATALGRIPVGVFAARMSGLTPGDTYTVKLQATNGAAGTMTVTCNANQPIWIQAVER